MVTIPRNLSFGTPLVKGQVHSRDTKLDPEKCSYSVLSILPNKPVRNNWKYQEKMAPYFSVETNKVSSPIKRSIYISTEILTTA